MLNLQLVLQLKTYLSSGQKGAIFSKAFKPTRNLSTKKHKDYFLYFSLTQQTFRQARRTIQMATEVNGPSFKGQLQSDTITLSLQLPTWAELEILHKEALCRWQHLHMTYLTFRETERLYSIQNIPGTVIYHVIKVIKLKSNPPWWWVTQALCTLPRGMENSLALRSMSQRIIRTSPRINSSVSPASNRMTSPLPCRALSLTIINYSSTFHRTHLDKRKAYPLLDHPYTDSSTKITWEAKCCFRTPGTVCNCQTSIGNPEPVECLGVKCPSVQDLLGEKTKL